MGGVSIVYMMWHVVGLSDDDYIIDYYTEHKKTSLDCKLNPYNFICPVYKDVSTIKLAF